MKVKEKEQGDKVSLIHTLKGEAFQILLKMYKRVWANRSLLRFPPFEKTIKKIKKHE